MNDGDDDIPDSAPNDDGDSEPPYRVGYGRPPLHRRIKPGERRNPRGRPKGTRNQKTILQEIAYETHTIPEDGKSRRVSTIELVLIAVRNLAINRNIRALHLMQDYEQRYQTREIPHNGGYLILPEPLPFEETMRLIAEHQRKLLEKDPEEELSQYLIMAKDNKS